MLKNSTRIKFRQMNALPFMPLYWNDFLSDNKVRVMSNEELGAYFRLLGAAWHEDIPGTLPADDDVLARLAGAELSLWRKLSRRILPCFTLNEQSGRYDQQRMMREHAKCVANMEMKHARAAAGAEKRWGKKPDQSPPVAQAMLKHEPSNANQNQNQNQSKDIPPHARDAGDSEIPDRSEAIGIASSRLGVIPNFAGYVYDDWASRGGRDATGNVIGWVFYVTKRWNREGAEWEAGTHRGNKNLVNGKTVVTGSKFKPATHQDNPDIPAGYRRHPTGQWQKLHNISGKWFAVADPTEKLA